MTIRAFFSDIWPPFGYSGALLSVIWFADSLCMILDPVESLGVAAFGLNSVLVAHLQLLKLLAAVQGTGAAHDPPSWAGADGLP